MVHDFKRGETPADPKLKTYWLVGFAGVILAAILFQSCAGCAPPRYDVDTGACDCFDCQCAAGEVLYPEQPDTAASGVGWMRKVVVDKGLYDGRHVLVADDGWFVVTTRDFCQRTPIGRSIQTDRWREPLYRSDPQNIGELKQVSPYKRIGGPDAGPPAASEYLQGDGAIRGSPSSSTSSSSGYSGRRGRRR